MQKILIVNLMRMGDILQTSPLIGCLRAKFPSIRIDLVLSEAFLDAGRRVGADAVHPFPVQGLRDLLSRGESLEDALRELEEFVESVNRGGPYDLVCNLTPSRLGASLASLFVYRSRVGMWMEEDGSLQTTDPWTSYLVAMMSNRRRNPFHLVDIWMRALGVSGPGRLSLEVRPEDAERTRELLTGLGVKLDRELLVGFQLSASQKEKCWSEREFIRLGQSLHRALKARVLLFGVDQEQHVCRRVGAQIPGSVNLAGKTDLGVLATALRSCRALVTNDTGTLHVATAVETPVVVVSVGPVNFRETGPYGTGHWIFQARLPCAPCHFDASCLRPVCKETIRAEHVYGVLLHVLGMREELPRGLPADVACYRSDFDREGWLDFRPCEAPSDEDRTLLAYRELWRSLLESDPRAGRDGTEAVWGPEALPAWHQLLNLLRRSAKLVRMAHETGQARMGDGTRWKVVRENLRQVEMEMRRTSLEAADLSPFVHYLTLRREALSFGNPLEFLEKTSCLYSHVAEQLEKRSGTLTNGKGGDCHAGL